MKPHLLAAAFGPRAEAAARYLDLLAGPAITQGLLGPREAESLLERHLLPSAALATLVQTPPSEASFDRPLLDLGTGAGLPGLPIALARPDLSVSLVEPLQRRVRFLDEAVSALDLRLPTGQSQVAVVRSRAEDLPPQSADVIVARAVAPALRLAAWSLPLLRPGGVLLAPKGSRLQSELKDLDPHRRELDIAEVRVEQLHDVADGLVTVLRLVRGDGRVSSRTARDLGRHLKGPDLRHRV
ncbi:MAG: 16S rRNA (guanine(527)-N(7))-methyltransferase RsmG [Actinomycetes bacterium]